MRNTHPKHMSSALPPNSDITRPGRHFAFVPGTDIKGASCNSEGYASFLLLPRKKQTIYEFFLYVFIGAKRSQGIQRVVTERCRAGIKISSQFTELCRAVIQIACQRIATQKLLRHWQE